jgi:hypothetical protein
MVIKRRYGMGTACQCADRTMQVPSLLRSWSQPELSEGVHALPCGSGRGMQHGDVRQESAKSTTTSLTLQLPRKISLSNRLDWRAAIHSLFEVKCNTMNCCSVTPARRNRTSAHLWATGFEVPSRHQARSSRQEQQVPLDMMYLACHAPPGVDCVSRCRWL